MFDWIAKLFGGGNQQKSTPSAPRQARTQSRLNVPSFDGFDRAQIDNQRRLEEERRRREEERRRREEERKAREAAEQSRKAKEEAARKAKEIQQQQKKTVNPLANGDMFNLNISQKKQVQVPQKRTVQVGNKPVTMSQQQLDNVRKNPNAPYAPEVHAAAKLGKKPTELEAMKIKMEQKAADVRKAKVNSAKAGMLANQIGGTIQSGIKDFANLPSFMLDLAGMANIGDKKKTAKLSQDWQKGVDETVGKWRPTGGKTYNEMIADTEKSKDSYMKQIYQNGGSLNNAEIAALALSEGIASFVSPTEAAVGINAATKLGRFGDEVTEATGDVIGATSRTGKIYRDTPLDNIEREAEVVSKEAEIAINQLPDQVTIQKQATEAGRIDDGISSPSRTEQVKSNLTQEVERQKAEIEQNYSNQLIGLDELRQSLLPRPLATELAGTPDVDPGMMARQADFEPEVVQPTPELPQLEAPMKAPLVQSMDSPNEAASKAAAEAMPPPAPVNAAPVKTRTIDDMTDEEVVAKFGKTREEIAASRAELEAEKAAKAERKKAKEDREAKKAAALEQAAIDAGEAPSKDILAGKTKRTAESPEKAVEAPTKAPSKDILAGKKKSDQAPTKEAPKKADVATAKTVSEATGQKVTQKQVNKVMTDSLFEKGGTKTSTKEVAEAIKAKAPTKQAVDDKAIKPTIKGNKPVVQTVNSKGEVLSEAPAKKKDILAGKKKGDKAPAKIPSYVPADRVDEYLKSADYKRDLEFDRMASETKSGDPFDHPDMYDNPTPEMYDNLKPRVDEPQVQKTEAKSAPAKTPSKQAAAVKTDDGWTTTKNSQGENVDTKDYDHYDGGKITKEVTHFKTGGTMDKYIATKDDGTTRTYNRLGDATNFLKKPNKAKPAPTTKTTASTSDIFAGKKKSDTVPTKDAKGTGQKHTTAPNEQKKFVASDKGVEEAAPSKDPIDTDYIREKARTGEKKRSTSKTGENDQQTRGKYDALSRALSMKEATNFAKNTPIEDFIKYALKKDRLTPADENVAKAYQALGRAKNDIEKGQLKDIRKRAKVDAAQDMALFSRFERRTATNHEINAEYEDLFDKNGFSTDPDEMKKLEDLSADYTQKRDAVKAAREKAIGSKNDKDIDALEKAVDEAYEADRKHQLAAYDHALQSAKAMEKAGEPLTEAQFAALKKLEQKASIFQYDAVDSSLLSATGTMINNLINGVMTVAETGVFGKGASRLASKFVNRGLKEGSPDKVYVGGYSTKGAGMGFKEGVKSIRAEVRMRNALNRTGGNKPMKKVWGAYKNTVTTLNELSETAIRARIQAKTYDHYMQINKDAGLKGDALRKQSRIDALTDPLEHRHMYEKEAYLTQGMSALNDAARKDGVKKVERNITDAIANGLKENTPLGKTLKGRAYADYAGKMTSRFFVGFPTVVWKSGVVAGAKRTPVAGWIIDAGRYSKATNAQEKAQILAEGLEHAASGAGFAGVGVFLGATGVVTGAYPSDPNEQKRWQAEGKTEWSIRLGSDYYDIRKSLGAFALPVMMYAQLGQNMADKGTMNPFEGIIPDTEGATAGSYAEAFTKSPLMAMWGVTPVEGPLARVNDVAEILNGKKGWADLASTATRMHLPAAGFINQLAKINTALDGGEELEARTKDNSLSGQVQEFINRIAVAVPGGGEALGLEAKQTLGVDHRATSVIGKIFGAQKGYNPEGAAVVQKQKDAAASASVSTKSVSDSTFDKVLETMNDDTKGLYKRLVKEGKTLKPESQKKVDDAIAGLADTDRDFESRFSQEGDWETQQYILAKKKEKLSADKSTKPDRLQELDREIGRTDILSKLEGDPKENAKTYYKYKGTPQSDLKKMLDDEDLDNYDPETAQMLLEMDEMFTNAGLSWNTTGDNPWTKKKYDLDKIKKALKSRGGGGGGGGKNLLETNVNVLKVNESEGLDGLKYKTVGGMPNVMASTPRKNFKKSISVKSGVRL